MRNYCRINLAKQNTRNRSTKSVIATWLSELLFPYTGKPSELKTANEIKLNLIITLFFDIL